MTTEAEIPVEDRILQVLQHLGIEKAHFGARASGDWSGLATNHPEVVSSLTLVCPRGVVADAASVVSSRLLVFLGDQGNQAQAVKQALEKLPDAREVVLPNYLHVSWSDALADRAEQIIPALTDFLSEKTEDAGVSGLSRSEREVADISYRIQGSGPPLVLLPMGLAASQWETVVEQLSQRFCTIILGGAHLGMMPQLEHRAKGSYANLRRSLVDELALKPGETILDVGCGSGVHDRWLARHTNGTNPIIALDVNPYLLREAHSLAEKESLQSAIEFRQGNAEAIPFEDNSFDVTMSITVIEEVNADRMLSEMVRVTKPRGRVGVASRSVDLPTILNLPLNPELKAKLEAPGAGGGGASEHGCADVSLYRRFQQVGLANVKMMPQLGVASQGSDLRIAQENITGGLSQEELEQWRVAVAQAEAEGTFFIARPLHCAVGTKPE